MDQALDCLGSSRVFSLFDLVSSFHQITAHKDTVPLTAFCTPTGLYEWLVMAQGSSASPGPFVKVINEVIKGLKQVAAYLDDVIVFDFDLVAHVRTIHSLFEHLRKYIIKLCPSKAPLDATDANVLDHSIAPAGLRPNVGKVSALTNMPMPTDVKQVRALMGGVNYHRATYRRGFFRLARSSGRVLSLHSRLPWRSWCKKSWRSSRPRRSSSSLIGTPSPTAHAHFTCIGTPASTGSALLPNRIRRTAP